MPSRSLNATRLGVAVVTIEGSVTDLPLLRLSEAEVIISGWEPPQLGRVGEVAWRRGVRGEEAK
jgi:hypothetical protein